MKMEYSILVKVIYTFIFLAQGTLQMINFFPTQLNFLAPTLEIWKTLNLIIGVLVLIAFINLFIRIWKKENVTKQTKGMWIILIVILPLIFGIIYIWKIDDKLNEK